MTKRTIFIGLCGITALYIVLFLVQSFSNDILPPKPQPPIPHTPIDPTPREVTLVATGDLLIHSTVFQAAKTDRGWDFDPMFRYVAPFLSQTDSAICHIETPLSPDNTNLSGYPLFNVPHQLAETIARSGYDTCSLASNHATDMGIKGIEGTITALNDVGVQHHGMARSPEEAQRLNLLTVGDFTIAHLSYTYGLNTGALKPNNQHHTNIIDVASIIDDAQRTRENGAEFVLISLHWGNEYRQQPSAYQTERATALLNDDAIDMIIGHHAHVIQPVGIINEKYVAYGLGNFLSDQTPRGCNCPKGVEDGVMLFITIAPDENKNPVVKNLEYIPTYVKRPGFEIIPISPDTDDPEEIKSAQRTKDALQSLGAPITERIPT